MSYGVGICYISMTQHKYVHMKNLMYFLSIGQVQPNKHEPRAQMMPNAQKNPAPELDREPTVEKRAQLPVSSLPPSPPSQATSGGLPIASSNGYPGVGTSAPPVIMQQFVNDGSTGFSPELEFGSLGPFQPG